MVSKLTLEVQEPLKLRVFHLRYNMGFQLRRLLMVSGFRLKKWRALSPRLSKSWCIWMVQVGGCQLTHQKNIWQTDAMEKAHQLPWGWSKEMRADSLQCFSCAGGEERINSECNTEAPSDPWSQTYCWNGNQVKQAKQRLLNPQADHQRTDYPDGCWWACCSSSKIRKWKKLECDCYKCVIPCQFTVSANALKHFPTPNWKLTHRESSWEFNDTLCNASRVVKW